MNWEQMKKNKGARVQLQPVACRIDENGGELPTIDDDWIVEEVSADGVQISNSRTGHKTTLGKDHITEYTSNPDRSRNGIKHGFLTLKVQILLRKNGLSIRPTRPGEPLKPQRVEIVEKWVDLDYPSRSGIQKNLEAEGFTVGWCWLTRLSQKIDIEGWEEVVEFDQQGRLTNFRTQSGPDQALIKKRNK